MRDPSVYGQPQKSVFPIHPGRPEIFFTEILTIPSACVSRKKMIIYNQ